MCSGSAMDGANIRDQSRPFELTANVTSGVISARLFGFWSTDDVDVYFQKRRLLSTKIRNIHGLVRALLDLQKFPPQSQSVIEAVKMQIKGYSADADILAVVGGASIIRLQFGRISKHFIMRHFKSSEEALHWLEGQPSFDSAWSCPE